MFFYDPIYSIWYQARMEDIQKMQEKVQKAFEGYRKRVLGPMEDFRKKQLEERPRYLTDWSKVIFPE
jgi:uncharacterized protein YydD (DUF2326 family)